MVMVGVDSYLQQVVRGAIIALAVSYDIWAKTRETKGQISSAEPK